MNKLFYLSTCSTCKRIMKKWSINQSIFLVDIKKTPLDDEDLDQLYLITNSYEKLFNKRAQLLKKKNISVKSLIEDDYKKLILEHYSFLKRPILMFNNKLFIGNSPNIVENAEIELSNK